mmetsp:Transcript_46719/g.84317  ORF Transcript_46719/g.84317 Transcript_46719/m.84317 type:complete len:133 (+) Transcript_46719:85-483(+)
MLLLLAEEVAPVEAHAQLVAGAARSRLEKPLASAKLSMVLSALVKGPRSSSAARRGSDSCSAKSEEPPPPLLGDDGTDFCGVSNSSARASGADLLGELSSFVRAELAVAAEDLPDPRVRRWMGNDNGRLVGD